VRPRVVFGEVRQEGGGGNRPCAGRADVGDVGEIGFELVFVGFKERQLPCFVVHVAGGGDCAEGLPPTEKVAYDLPEIRRWLATYGPGSV